MFHPISKPFFLQATAFAVGMSRSSVLNVTLHHDGCCILFVRTQVTDSGAWYGTTCVATEQVEQLGTSPQLFAVSLTLAAWDY
jgi:hypothetical protein